MSDKIRERIRHRRENAVDPEAFLLDVGVVETTDSDEQLAFVPGFAARIERYVGKFRHEGAGEPVIARIFGVGTDDVSIPDRPYTAFKVLNTVYNWPSPDALVLDAATDTAFRERTDRWEAVPPRQRYRILQSLRSFQDDCLFCSGEVVFTDDLVESCCSPREVLSLHCADCGRRFLEFSTEENARDAETTVNIRAP